MIEKKTSIRCTFPGKVPYFPHTTLQCSCYYPQNTNEETKLN